MLMLQKKGPKDQNQDPSKKQLAFPPGPRGWDSIKTLLRMRNDSLAAYQELHQKYGDVVYLPGPIATTFLFHPRHIKKVLVDEARSYQKGIHYHELLPLLGQGLVTSDGELWKKERRLVGHEFSPKMIKSYSLSIHQFTQELFQKWESKGDFKSGRYLEMDLRLEMTALTLRVASYNLFGIDAEKDSVLVGKNFNLAAEIALERMYSLLKIPRILPTPRNLREKKAIKTLDQIVFDLIRRYQNEPGLLHKENVLSKLLSAFSANDSSLKQLRDEVITLLLAGHDTTSNALTWTIYLVSQHPSVEEKICQELKQVLGGATPQFEDLEKLAYLKKVLYESMRLYPPVPAFGRKNMKVEQFDDLTIPAGTNVSIIPYVTHRDERFWPNPDSFIPERFEEEPYPLSYFPFAAGARKCIGEDFAMMEALLVLATLFQRFHFSLTPDFIPQAKATITLHPHPGMLMRVVKK